MADYMLSCESTVDVTPELLASRNIEYVCFNYELDGVSLKDDFGQTNSPAQLYAKMLAGADARTSQVSVGNYIEFFTPALEAGRDIVHVTLSSGISGTYGSAKIAADALSGKYPNQHLYIVDSLAASAGYGLLMDRLADLRDGGMSAADLVAWTEEHRLELQHWFFSTDLTFFIRGGRISKAAGLIGGALKICPVMDVAPDGSLAVKEKIRAKHRAESRVLEIMQQHASCGAGYPGKVFISNSECLADAKSLAERIEYEFPHIDGKVQIFDIGATIGVHTGPGTVALFYWGDRRV